MPWCLALQHFHCFELHGYILSQWLQIYGARNLSERKIFLDCISSLGYPWPQRWELVKYTLQGTQDTPGEESAWNLKGLNSNPFGYICTIYLLIILSTSCFLLHHSLLVSSCSLNSVIYVFFLGNLLKSLQTNTW